jgi:hypothetical protein
VQMYAWGLPGLPPSSASLASFSPPEMRATRLQDRERLQGAIERLFELDVTTNLDLVRIIDRLHDLLRNRNQLVLHASSLDQRSLRESSS